jgi:winged helix DNA-binding protein
VPSAVERLYALQAQEPRPPFVALWTRLRDFDAAELRGALQQRSVVRATLMRATLHEMSAEDFLAVRPTLRPQLEQAARSRMAADAGPVLDEVLAAARALLAERPRTFEELRRELAQAFPKVDDRALGSAVRLHLDLVMVPSDERWGFPRVAEFALAEGWLGRRPAEDASPDQLVLRYLSAYGPATAADVQSWSGLRGVAGVLSGLRERLRVFRGPSGRELFDLPDAPRPGADTPAPPRFLAEFDSLILAHADRARLLREEHRPRMASKNLRVPATFLWDGAVSGTWRIERRSARARLQLTPFVRLTRAALKALTEEGESLLGFAEPDARSAEVQWLEVG